MSTTTRQSTVAGEAVQYVGRPLDRVDGGAKTSGQARYSGEYSFPDLAYAALVLADIPRGRISAIHAEEAAAVPGVVRVLTHENAPRMAPPPKVNYLRAGTAAGGARVSYLNTDEVFWNGQPVAMVVADSQEAADDAARLVRVDYVPLPAETDFVAAQEHAVPVKNNIVMIGEAKVGQPEEALAAAAARVDNEYSTPPHNHNAMEPHATTAVWDGDSLTVYDATQNIDWTRRHLAMRFEVPASGVRVIATAVGGGFGGKAAVWAGTLLAVLAARACARPVRLVSSRETVYRTVGARTPTAQRVALGADRDGRITALVHTGISQIGRVGGMAEPVTSQSGHVYTAPNILLRQATTELDALPNTFMRAPGEAMGSFALESALDELAVELGMDPVELRLRNDPERSPLDGKRFTRRARRSVYERGAERFGWAERPSAPRATREGRWLIGWGVAGAFYLPAQMPADVSVRLNADGTVLVRCAFQEIGIGAATAQAQITADALHVPVDAVTVEHGDSRLPPGPGAFASAQTASVAASVLEACEQLTGELDRLRKRGHGTGQDAPGAVVAAGGLPFIEARTGSDSALARGLSQVRFITNLVRDRRRFVRAATGAHFCQVKVDVDTGEIRVARWLGVFDVGRVINAKLASSQLRGGIIMGIGAGLEEEALIDPRNGRHMNADLVGYHLPVHADIPDIEVEYLDEPDPTSPLGLLGLGEVGITGTTAALANAVYHATGVRVRDLPITLDRLL
ncbi:xanthine dehydrogenase family protein molybdopterin-binding subunit [Leifsonia sp. McL0607]|uniref:xanthine dehydrogenase family protein molybdopterin-binding subunit n=1 Tax=Leifsonia sp. McL0607 TaxID=3415672 RepID=UPI003CF2B5F5